MRIAKWLGTTTLALGGLSALLFLAIQTSPGKALLASIASSLASSDAMKVEVAGVEGFLPSNARVRSVRLSDADGPFALVENIRLSWSPLALLRGVLDIESVGADRVEVLRKPLPAPAAADESSGGAAIPSLRIGRFTLGKVEIGEAVLGSEASLSLIASADLLAPRDGFVAEFDLQRLDAPGSMAAVMRYDPQSGALDVNMNGREPAGGLIARTLGIEGLPAVEATVKGAGPLDAFDAKIAISAGDVARIDGAASVRALEGGRRVTFTIDADAAKLLPQDIAPLFAGNLSLAGAGTIDDAMRADIETATIRAAGFEANARGTYDSPTASADLAFNVNLGPAALFAPLTPGADWTSLTLEGTAKGALPAPVIAAKMTAQGVRGAGYGAGSLLVNATARPDASGNLTFEANGLAEALSADDPNAAAALGEKAEFALSGRNDAFGPALSAFSARLRALTARFDGDASARKIAGTLNVEKLDLAAFGPLAGRPLAGAAALNASIDASGDLSRARLDVEGDAQGLSTGVAAVDRVFGERVTLAGVIARDDGEEFRIDRLRLVGDGLAIDANGSISQGGADLVAALALTDLERLDPRLAGAVNARATFTGGMENLGLKARVSIPSGMAMRQKIDGLVLDLEARDLAGAPAASFTLGGKLAGDAISGSGAFSTGGDGGRRIDDFALDIGSVAARGGAALDANGMATGRLTLEAGDLADLSALALTELAGKLNADITLEVEGGKQRVSVKADAGNVRADGQVVDRARIDAAVVDPAGVPMLNGVIELAGVKAGGVAIPKATLAADADAGGALIRLNAVANGATVAAAGHLGQRDAGALFRLDKLSIARGTTQISTAAPANIALSGGAVAIDRLALTTKGGGATISGSAGQTLDLAIDLRSLPLSLSELAAPGLGLTGTISGDAKIFGPAHAPNGAYKLTLARVSNPDLSQSGAGPLNIDAEGQLRGGRVETRARVSGPFFSDLVIAGSAPLAVGDLDLAIKGAVDLAAANPMLAASGARVSGRAVIDATVKGPPMTPRAGGSVRVSAGSFDDSVNGVSLSNIAAEITGAERSVTLSSMSASTRNGGRISAKGNVALDSAAGFPGKIDIELLNAGLVHSELMRFVGEGSLAIEGALAKSPRLTGRIVVKSLDVNIPDRLPGGASALDVRHVNAAGKKKQPAKPQPASPAPRRDAGMPLDIAVSAPNNVFVRGMGLEAELGGDIKVTGSSGAPVAQGAFEMRRGAFDIIGRRLNFTRGKISFAGSTDPELDFVAESRANDITAQILVNGPASKPSITFAATPALPQDEVLSRLMFGRASGSLTPAQAVQVAQTIAQFSGGGPGVMERMRRSLGVDSLNVGTGADGSGGQVGIGKRLNDKIYLGVKQGTTPNSSQVTIDVDITRNLRLQGATGADGSSEVGIGAQWDY